MKADIFVNRRSGQFHRHPAVGVHQVVRGDDEPALANARLAEEHDARCGQCARLRSCPALLDPGKLAIAPHQWATRLGRRQSFARDLIVHDEPVDALHGCGRSLFKLKILAHQWFYCA